MCVCRAESYFPEAAVDLQGFFLQHRSGHLHQPAAAGEDLRGRGVQTAIRKAIQRFGCAAEHHPWNPGPIDCPTAHGAWLCAGVQGAFCQDIWPQVLSNPFAPDSIPRARSHLFPYRLCSLLPTQSPHPVPAARQRDGCPSHGPLPLALTARRMKIS